MLAVVLVGQLRLPWLARGVPATSLRKMTAADDCQPFQRQSNCSLLPA